MTVKSLNQLVKNSYPFVSSLVIMAAVFGGANIASLFGIHQPKAPKCLK